MSAPESTTTYRGLPAATDPGFLVAVKELLETMAGQRGAVEDRVVTLRDLADASLVRYLNDQDVSVTRPDEANPPQDVPEPPYDLELITVDDPTRVNAFNHHLTWTLPDDDTISGTEIWVAVGTDSRTSATRVGIVTYPGNEYTYQNFDVTEHHYYWIRTFNWAGNYSTWHPTALAGGYLVTKTGSIKESIDKVMNTLKGEAPATWLVGTHYDVGDQVSHVCSDGQTRTYICVEHGTGEEPDGAGKAHWNRMGILTTGEVDGVACVGIDGNMVVDGTIITRNLDADCITAEKIAADAIEADHISVGAESYITPTLPSDNYLLMHLAMEDGEVPFTTSGLFVDSSGHGANVNPLTGAGLVGSPVTFGADYAGVIGSGAGIATGRGFSVPAATATALNAGAVQGVTYFSYSLWYKRMDAWNHTADWQFLICPWGEYTSGIRSYYHELGATVDGSWTTFGWTPTDGVWHHIVLVYLDRTNVSLWVDGVFKSTLTYGKIAAPEAIGNYTSTGAFAMPGVIDEIRVYKKQLSEEEINALYKFPASFGKVAMPWNSLPEGDTYGKIPKAWKHSSDTTKIDGGNIYTGTVVAGAIYTTSLSALSANLGTITAGLAKSSDGKIQVDFDNKWIKVWDASSVLRVHIGYIP